MGSVRVGVAKSDPDGLIATPVETVTRTPGYDGIERIVSIIGEVDALEVVVGLPRSLDGKERAAAGLARSFAQRLAHQVHPVPVVMVDERLTTTTAQRAMSASGRKARAQRTVVDQVAAVIILQNALDHERSTGNQPGRKVTSGGAERVEEHE